MPVAVFLFHRDLRLVDNTALLKAIRDGYTVLPVFVFPPEQIDPSKNRYFSNPAVQFMCECLTSLDAALKAWGSQLHLFRGDYDTVLNRISEACHVDAVYSNQDPSVYAQARDARIHSWCSQKQIPMISCEDYGLMRSDEGLLPDGRPYTVLAMFYKRFLKAIHVRKVDNRPCRAQDFTLIKHPNAMPIEEVHTLYTRVPNARSRGGRTEAKRILAQVKHHTKYAQERDFPAMEGTTRASPHLKFGTISIREMYWAICKMMGPDHALIRELVFRDFYLKIYSHRPELQRGVAFRTDVDKRIPWRSPTASKAEWRAWTTGTTGFPLADAGMRQLEAEGWVHNRVRMLVASVATRYLLLDWRACARYFYAHLMDADPFSNTAGWQWAAGVGVDSAPYFRAPFNPFRQSERFDQEGEYIKRWIPELASVSARDLHHWFDPNVRAKYSDVSYPAPILDPKEASARAVSILRQAHA
jgi:deoxyribodipyrimidine photo-lyase